MINQNRTKKYLLYAIGEIILVVIGILIALQINNWNELRKYNLLKGEYLERLINDIEQDTINMNYVNVEIEANQESIKKLISAVKQPSEQESLDSILTDYFRKGWIISEYVATDNTYTDLSQTGNMRIIENTDLIDEIIMYYGYVQQVTNYNNVNKNWMTPFDLELAKQTSAFELDPNTSHLFDHKDRMDAIQDIQDHHELIERNAAGHYWINESLAGNLNALKGVATDLLTSLHQEREKLR